MSASRWAYDHERCDGHFCPGDCDFCQLWEETDEDEDEYEEDMQEERKNYK